VSVRIRRRQLHLSTATLLGALLLSCCTLWSTPATADGGASGWGYSIGGADNPDGPGGTGTFDNGNPGAGGGGGAGVTGGDGAEGSSIFGPGVAGGAGGANPGDDGADGTANTTSSRTGGGGGGGAAGLTGAAMGGTGGHGGNGGGSTATTRSAGGGGGAGGYGVILTPSSSPVTFTDGATGGNGGNGGDASQASTTYAGDGGTGGTGVYVNGAAADVTFNGVQQGGDGGGGGNGSASGGGVGIARGGDGGAGGDAVQGSGATITIGGQALGGNGGDGGNASAPPSYTLGRGSGGDGGNGVSGESLTIINSATIQGGDGGRVGTGGSGGQNGEGGAGISGSALTILNSATVAGGLSGGGAQGNAITFTGGANVLTTNGAGSYTGAIDIVRDTLTLLQTTAGGATGSATYTGASTVTGAGALIVTTDSGYAVTFSAANTYSGGTTITEGSMLTISDSGALGSGGVAMNGGTTGATINFDGSLTIANDFTLTGDPTFNVLTGDTTTISGQITGSGDVVVNDGGAAYEGTLVLSNGGNDYTGPTSVVAGTLQAGASGVFGDNSAMTVASGATLGLAGFSNSVGSLAGAGTVTNSGGSAATLTAGGDNSSTTFFGILEDGTSATALTKTGTGRLTLSGNNTYSGGTTIEQGTLRLESNTAAGTGTITTLGSVIEYGVGVNIANPIDLNSDTTQLNVDSPWFAIQAGDISETNGPRPLEKIGGGRLHLTGTNTFTGPLTISDGSLALSNGAAVSDVASVVLGGGSLEVTNSETIGSLSGSGGVSVNGGQVLTIGGNDSSTTFSGFIVDNLGSGSLTKIGDGTLTLDGNSTYTGATTVDGGTLVVDGLIASAVTVNDGAMLGGSGATGGITVNAGGTFAPGNSIGTMTVIGALSMGAGSTFEVEVDAAGRSDKVVVYGTVNLTGAALRVLAANGNYKVSTDYTIIENDGTDAVVGKFASVTSSLAFLTASVVYDGGDGNDVVLTLERAVAPSGSPLSFCWVANSKNQCNVATALDGFPTGNALFLAVLNQTAEGARQAYDALSGEIHATVAGTLADDSRYVREAVLGRLMQATHAGEALAASGPQVASLDQSAMALGYGDGSKSLAAPARQPLAFWTRAYGAWGDFDGDGNAATADRDLGGFVSGMDASIGGSWRAGLATGASFANVDVDARYSSADVESYHLGGYLGGMAGAFALRGGGMWAWNDVDTSRAVVFPGFFERQKASYDADTGQLFGEVAYPTQMGGIALEPFGGLALVSIDTASFRERGGALASLRGVDVDQNVGYSTLGVRAATTMQFGGMQVVPHVSAAWQHALDDVTPDAALAFAGTGIGFTVYGVPLAEDSALIDAGLDFALGERTTAGVSYTGQFGDGVSDNGVKGRFTWLF
jgi:outer membrane autotransporter protein